MCCTSIAPCWEQHAPWGNITYFPQPKNAFKHLHSLPPLELSSCSLPSPPRPRIHVSFLVPPTLKVNSVPPAKCSSPSHRALPLPRRSSAPHPRESLADHLMQHYACYRFLYFIELPLEIISFV